MKHEVRTNNFHRTGKTVVIDGYARARAVKIFCTECLGFEDHPKDCTANLCPLFPFRGKSTLAYDGESE